MKTLNILLLIFIIIWSGCKKDSNPVGPDDGGTGNKIIEVGESVELVANQAIGTTGGKIIVNKPGDKLNGLEITIPTNAFTETKNFKVSYSEIKSHQLGQYFNPISPMIKISYEGGYADDIISVKVPVKIPSGYFAMGFFYDENTGTIEGLPLLSLDSTSVTVCTRHFSTSTISTGSTKSIFKGNDYWTSFCNMIISSIKETELLGKPLISTGYKLGEDDWEFPNCGSYISPIGHCAGQSMTSMWYYYEKHLHGSPNLYSQYDEVDKIWEDNPRGYRFASTVQQDMNWKGILQRFFTATQQYPLHLMDFLSWHAFVYTMLLGEPQFVSLLNESNGHAVVAYQISILDGLLYVADPNFPGQLRTIKYQNGFFQPYSSKQNANEIDNTSFTSIGYCSKTSMVEWDKISSRWKEFESGTIGNDRFPTYQLFVVNDMGKELSDGFTTDLDRINVQCTSRQCQQFIPGTDYKQLLEVYDNNGNLISYGDTVSKGITNIPLKLGLNKLGFSIQGARNNIGNNYVDFKWINVTKDTMAIEPKYLSGQINKEYMFTAKSFGTAPKNYKIVWNFGDGAKTVTVNNDSTVKHIFTYLSDLGPFQVMAKMYDQTNQIIAVASAAAEITSTPVTIISSSSDGAPISKAGVVGQEYSFIAKHNGQAPKNGTAKFVWDFGDNTTAVTKMNDSLVKHTYTKPGSFTISIKLYSDVELISEGTAKVNIKSTTLLKIESASSDGAPILTTGIKNKEYTFVARTYGTAPKQYKMVWNFGDNISNVTVNNDSTAKHTYASDNTYTMSVMLYDQSNIKLAEANAVAEIKTSEIIITGIDPKVAPIGDTVKISGKGFGNTQGSSYVTFKGDKRASILLWSDNVIKVIVPDGTESGDGYITVYVGNKPSTANSNSYFTCQGSLIDTLLTKKRIHCFFGGYFYLTNGDSSSFSFGIDSRNYPAEYPEIVWSGKTFTLERKKWDLTEKMTGTFSNNGLILLSLKYEYIFSVSPGSASPYKIEKGFTVVNIPFNNQWAGYSDFRLHASEGLKEKTTDIYYNQYFVEGSSTKVIKIKTINWFYKYIQATFNLGM